MSVRELTCREIADFLMAYEDGELSDEVRGEFDAHLESYRATVALGKQAFADADAAAADQVPEELVQAVLAARRRQRPS
jgi:anti-sigma factor RsiW